MTEFVFVGIPCKGQVAHGLLTACLTPINKRRVKVSIVPSSYSILTHNFNTLYCAALNNRENGVTHFCMVHDDIIPENHWLEKMLVIMERVGADILSAISPIKNDKGMTSTALDIGNPTPYWTSKRITMHETYNKYPPTFTHEKLLVNTGLMLVDLRKPWVEQVWFENIDRIEPDPRDPTKLCVRTVPEDWNFSRKARDLGAHIYATSEVKLRHVGSLEYHNQEAWGRLKEDVVDA